MKEDGVKVSETLVTGVQSFSIGDGKTSWHWIRTRNYYAAILRSARNLQRLARLNSIAFPVGAYFRGIQAALQPLGLWRQQWSDDLACNRSPLDYSASARRERRVNAALRLHSK